MSDHKRLENIEHVVAVLQELGFDEWAARMVATQLRWKGDG